MASLELRDVVVEYHQKGRPPVRAVAGVDLSVDRGQIVGLVGETGCGKSSLARVAVGLEPPTEGEVLLEGRPLAFRKHRARGVHEQRIQMVFQNPFGSLNPRRKVGDQIADGLRGRLPSRTERRREVSRLLEEVGLAYGFADRYPHQFSGGQRQRIAIARALAASPSIIVLDEPLSSLDASVQAQVANLLRSLARQLDVGMLLISHDLAIVHHVADQAAVMYLGEIVESGPTETVWSHPMHPYTRALIGAIPSITAIGSLPESLPGEVPDPARPPAGCRFRPRCPHAFDRCVEAPSSHQIDETRRVACWLHVQSPAPRDDGAGAGAPTEPAIDRSTR